MTFSDTAHRRLVSASVVAALTSAGIAGALPPAAQAQEQQAQRGALEEVVVTARRREEQLQDVPISIQALSGEDVALRGIESGADLNVMIPNLAIGNDFVNVSTNLTLRGIPNVGIYVDGIWQPSAGLYQNRLVDLERVEVMRGPQGTLFGRNTNGGAIQYTTRQPGEEFNLDVGLTVGSFGRQDVTMSVDMPLTDNLLMRWSGASMNSDGWMESLAVPDRAYGGRDDTVFRGDILWRPTDRFEARLTASKSDTSSPAARQVRWSTQGVSGRSEHPRQTIYNVAMLNPDYGPYDFWTDPLPEGTNRFPIHAFTAFTHDPEYPGGLVGDFQNRSVAPTDGNQFDIDQYTLTTTWDVTDNFTFRSLTAYREQFTRGLTDFFTSEIVFALADNRLVKNRLFSEELHFEGSALDGKVDYLVGLYYSRDRRKFRQYRWGMHEFFVPDANGNPVVDTELRDFVRAWGVANNDAFISGWNPVFFYNGGSSPTELARPDRTNIDDDFTEEEALFGEATWNITDRLRVTGGIRFSWNDGVERTLAATEAFRDFDPPHQTGRRGYGPGNPFAGTLILEEADFLTTDVESTPAVSLAYNWKDNLMTYVRYAEGFTRGEENFDADLQQTITLDPEVVENWEFGLRSDWLSNRLRFNFTMYRMIWNGIRVTKQFPTADGDLILATVSGGKARARGFESEMIFAAGDNWRFDLGYAMNDTTYLEVGDESPLTPDTPWGFAPKYNANVGVQFDSDMSNGGAFMFRADAGYTSSFQMDPAVQRQAPQNESSYTLVNARVRYTPPAGDWSVSLFGTNLSDERYITGGIDAGQLWGIQFLDIGQRRMFGVQLDIDFGG